MAQFEYGKVLNCLMTPEVVSALGSVREHRGRQELYKSLQPATLEKLCEVAKIQSTGASNRIENISTSEVRLRELMQRKVEPANRDEREIAGYRYVLDMIHERHDGIPVTPSVILQLHRDLYRFCDVSFAGCWKDSDNVIAERVAGGRMVARFVPTSAAATPGAVERICEEYGRWLKDGTYDPLLVSLVFAFDFVSIHPFSDGNGRMSRLLTLLLTYRSGYDVGKYVSIEAEIERTKATYYEALAASSAGWAEGEADYAPFVTYMLGVMNACYADLDERVALLSSGGKGEDILRAYFEGLVGTATKRRILDDNPTLSRRTAERVLQKLQAEGAIEKVGAARATAYRRVER
jgi:Fic family protein